MVLDMILQAFYAKFAATVFARNLVIRREGLLDVFGSSFRRRRDDPWFRRFACIQPLETYLMLEMVPQTLNAELTAAVFAHNLINSFRTLRDGLVLL